MLTIRFVTIRIYRVRFLFAFLIGFWPSISVYGGCIFDLVLGKYGSQEAYLELFKPEADIKPIVDLSSQVWRVESEGLAYTLRTQPRPDDAAFEAFAAEFMKASPVETILVRRLSETDSRQVIRKLALANRDYSQTFYDKPEYRGRAVTLSPFFPDVQRGADYLFAAGVWTSRETAAEDAFEKLDPKMLSQIADFWAAYTILGIRDPHPGNWMTLEGKLLALDLAMTTEELREGTVTLQIGNGKEPFSYRPPTISTIAKLKGYLSPQMRRFITDLNASKLRDFSRAAKTRLKLRELSGILGRAELVLE